MNPGNGGGNIDSVLELETVSEVLRELILIPSSGIDDRRRIVEHAMGYLEGCGLDCELLGTDQSPAIFSSSGGGGLTLSGHLDTVPVGSGWSVDQGEVRGPLIYGRGATDMKGGCAAMLLAAKALTMEGLPISLTLTTDEESGMGGAEAIAKGDLISNTSAIVICEPTSLKIGLRESGLLQLGILTRGKASHASMPEEGDNAIHKMLIVLDRIKKVLGTEGSSTVDSIFNIGVLRGGEKVNVIPDLCEAEIDIRTGENVNPTELLDRLRGAVEGIDHKIDILNMLDPISISMETDIVRRIKSIRPGIETCDIAFVTEMVKYRAKNDNMVTLGPGDPRQAHKINEHVNLGEVLDAAKIYYELGASIAEKSH